MVLHSPMGNFFLPDVELYIYIWYGDLCDTNKLVKNRV